MFGYRITKDKEIIEAIKTVEELRKVLTVLKNDIAVLEGHEACKCHTLSSKECRHFNISPASYTAAILSLYDIKKEMENE